MTTLNMRVGFTLVEIRPMDLCLGRAAPAAVFKLLPRQDCERKIHQPGSVAGVFVSLGFVLQAEQRTFAKTRNGISKILIVSNLY